MVVVVYPTRKKVCKSFKVSQISSKLLLVTRQTDVSTSVIQIHASPPPTTTTRYFNPGTVFITAAILILGCVAQKQNGDSDENCAGIKVPITTTTIPNRREIRDWVIVNLGRLARFTKYE